VLRNSYDNVLKRGINTDEYKNCVFRPQMPSISKRYDMSIVTMDTSN